MCVVFLRSLSVESMWVPQGPLAEPLEDAMPVGGHAGGGGTASARRRRERRLRQRRLRQHWRHEQLTLRMVLAATQHHSARRGLEVARTRGEESETKYTAEFWQPARSTVTLTTRACRSWVGSGLRPCRRRGRREGTGRHTGVGFERRFKRWKGVWCSPRCCGGHDGLHVCRRTLS